MMPKPGSKSLVGYVTSLGLGKISLQSLNKAILCPATKNSCHQAHLNMVQLARVFKGEFLWDGQLYRIASNKETYTNSNLKSITTIDSSLPQKEVVLPGLRIRIYGNTTVDVNTLAKSISFRLESESQKVVIYDSDLAGWKINALAKRPPQQNANAFRYDTNLLTSSLTIKDSSLDQASISFDGGLQEDSVNLLRTNGNLSKIRISNSNQDALDIDFSNLSIDLVEVSESGNDCIDLSSGNYRIRTLVLSGCRDKAISVGEKSIASFENLNIRNSTSAVVVKDSSYASVDKSDISDVKRCAVLYRKKQEFQGARLNINRRDCPRELITVQVGSEVVFR